MAEISASDGVTIHYEIEGTQYGPPLVFSNSLGTNFHMWDGQVGKPTELGFRVIRYDQRGHGRSAAPKEDYTLARLADDLVELLNALRIEKTAFCGLSMGGFTGIHLGKRHPRASLASRSATPLPSWHRPKCGTLVSRRSPRGHGGRRRFRGRALVHAELPRRRIGRGRAHPRDDPLHRARRIRRVLRRDP